MPECPQCGGPTWDNRNRKTKPTQPDFKCKDKSCDGAIWLDRKKPSQTEWSSQREPSSSTGDDRINRIERQHSQQMALMFFALNNAVPTTKQLRDMTSWFQRDIGQLPKPEDEPESEVERVERRHREEDNQHEVPF